MTTDMNNHTLSKGDILVCIEECNTNYTIKDEEYTIIKIGKSPNKISVRGRKKSSHYGSSSYSSMISSKQFRLKASNNQTSEFLIYMNNKLMANTNTEEELSQLCSEHLLHNPRSKIEIYKKYKTASIEVPRVQFQDPNIENTPQ